MSFDDIQKTLLMFGFKDCTKKWYESWKIQKVFRYRNKYYVVFDKPNIELIKNTDTEDYSLGLTPLQLKGLLAFLSLSYNHRNEIHDKKLHLDKLYSQIKSKPHYFGKKAYERFVNVFDGIKISPPD